MPPKELLLTTKDLSPIATNGINEGEHFISINLFMAITYPIWMCNAKEYAC